MRISDWSSDVCSSDLEAVQQGRMAVGNDRAETPLLHQPEQGEIAVGRDARPERQPALGQPCIEDTAVLHPLMQQAKRQPGKIGPIERLRDGDAVHRAYQPGAPYIQGNGQGVDRKRQRQNYSTQWPTSMPA